MYVYMYDSCALEDAYCYINGVLSIRFWWQVGRRKTKRLDRHILEGGISLTMSKRRFVLCLVVAAYLSKGWRETAFFLLSPMVRKREKEA